MTTTIQRIENEDELYRVVRDLHRAGWEYQEDPLFPASDPRRIGWWVNPAHPDKCRRTGDSRPFWYQTEVAYSLYYAS